MSGITEDKLRHSIGVARYMSRRAFELGWAPSKAQDMFVLGWVHDIGYEFDETNGVRHSAVGGSLLEEVGYKYWQEVACHGLPLAVIEDRLSSVDRPVLDLLNEADLHIDIDGKEVTLNERLKGIAERCGSGSINYLTALELAQKMLDWDPSFV